MGLIKLYFAKIFDENGEFLKNKYFNKHNDTFKYGKKSFNINRKDGSYWEDKGIFIDKRYYIYNISNPDPYKLEKEAEPIMNPNLYNTMLETKVAKKLNEANTTGIFDNIEFKHVLIAIAGIVGFILYQSGALNGIIGA